MWTWPLLTPKLMLCPLHRKLSLGLCLKSHWAFFPIKYNQYRNLKRGKNHPLFSWCKHSPSYHFCFFLVGFSYVFLYIIIVHMCIILSSAFLLDIHHIFILPHNIHHLLNSCIIFHGCITPFPGMGYFKHRHCFQCSVWNCLIDSCIWNQ